MQPYFLPYLGYFDLIRNTDRWIVFDTPQHIRHGWVSRNRILHPTAGWQYILVPLQGHSHKTAIRNILINDALPWRQRILGQLEHYRRRAPYFERTFEFLRDSLDFQELSLARLNVHLLQRVCYLLAIPFHPELFSEMSLDPGPIAHGGDWALRIAAALGADEYLNPPGGEALFDPAAFAGAGIKLAIRQPPCMEYRCRSYTFEPNLSIIDLLMWNSVEDVAAFLATHALPQPTSEGPQ